MPDVVEPGTRLVERYRLDERLGGAHHAGGAAGAPDPGEATTYWRAHDELLDRPVAVCLLQAGDEHAGRVLGAARRTAMLTDSRFLQVLDASEVDGTVYVVSEWVSAVRLVDLLADGPLPAGEARALTVEIAGALAGAHEAGLAHLCLAPEHVLRTAHGHVKLAGLGVDAAARGLAVTALSEAAARDTQAAAAVLYASLTARWPDGIPGATSRLPPAPHDGGYLCSPRQVRAGVPDDLDAVVCRALGVPGRHGGGPLRTPAELVTALAGTQATTRLPLPGAASPRLREAPATGTPYTSPYDEQAVRRRRPRAATVAWALAGLVLIAGLALAGGQLALTGLGGGEADAGSTQGDASSGPTAPAAGGPVKIAAATSFDPLPGNGDENSDRAPLAVDKSTGTAWPTKTYDDPFGPSGLKEGVGLLLDLGSPTDVSQVAVQVQGGSTDLEVRVADAEGSELGDYRLLDQPAQNVDGRTVVRPDEPVPARYVLVWLTELPARDGGYRGEVAGVTVSGSGAT